jgi:hypothetical protein
MPPKRKASPPPPGAPSARERKKQKVAAAREIAVQSPLPPPRVRFAGMGENAVAGPSAPTERNSGCAQHRAGIGLRETRAQVCVVCPA